MDKQFHTGNSHCKTILGYTKVRLLYNPLSKSRKIFLIGTDRGTDTTLVQQC